MKSTSRCPRCSNTEFEAVNETPLKSNFELIFIRCSSCFTVVGVVDYFNVGTLIKTLAEKLKVDLDI